MRACVRACIRAYVCVCEDEDQDPPVHHSHGIYRLQTLFIMLIFFQFIRYLNWYPSTNLTNAHKNLEHFALLTFSNIIDVTIFNMWFLNLCFQVDVSGFHCIHKVS